MRKISIIVAGGAGTRMKKPTPKQFLKLGPLPILMHTLSTFYSFDPQMELRLVLAENMHESWRKSCEEHNFSVPHSIFKGGKTRFHSVKNALTNIGDNVLVAIHDGVRPLVSQQTIKVAFETAKKEGCAVPVLPLTESVRKQEGKDTVACNRSSYFSVQTPQVFQSSLLLEAYMESYNESFTDDASVVEHAGYKIITCPGNEENIKITTAKDLHIAEALLRFRVS